MTDAKRLGELIRMTESEVIKNIDEEMIPIILVLNEKGYKTVACCQGHTKKELDMIDIYIMFKDKFIEFGKPLLKSQNKRIKEKMWNPRPYSTHQHTVIRYDIKNKGLEYEIRELERKEAMRLLYEWALSLDVRES